MYMYSMLYTVIHYARLTDNTDEADIINKVLQAKQLVIDKQKGL